VIAPVLNELEEYEFSEKGRGEKARGGGGLFVEDSDGELTFVEDDSNVDATVFHDSMGISDEHFLVESAGRVVRWGETALETLSDGCIH
jgi:hypothetical protein